METLEQLLLQLDLDQLKEGIEDPHTFLKQMEEKGGAFAASLAIEQLRPLFEELPEVRWFDVKEVLIEYCSDDAAFQCMKGPEFSLQLLEKDPRVQKKWQVALARNRLEKHLPKGIMWKDVDQLVEEADSEELRAVLADEARAVLSCARCQWCT